MKRLTYYSFIALGIILPNIHGAAAALQNPLGTNNISVVIGRIIKALLGLSGSIALLMFVWGGFLWLTSAGAPEKVKKGKDTLVWATIGLALIFASYTLVNFVIDALVTT